MSDERPMCWLCAEGAAKDGAEIERLTAGINKLVYLTKDYDQQIERLRALVGEMRGALTECAEELACISDTRSSGVVYRHARAVIAKADEVLRKEPVT